MADLDNFFAKKDKLKKKGTKGFKFSKANTDILAKNLEENDRKEENAEKKAAPLLATSEANRAGALLNDQSTVSNKQYRLISHSYCFFAHSRNDPRARLTRFS